MYVNQNMLVNVTVFNHEFLDALGLLPQANMHESVYTLGNGFNYCATAPSSGTLSMAHGHSSHFLKVSDRRVFRR